MAVLLPAFLGLGNWQLERAQEKRERLAQFADDSDRASLATLTQRQAGAGAGFVHVRGEGEYLEGAPQVLLEGMSHQGRAGYHVLTPLRLAGTSRLVLVNRGWIPRDFARTAPPEVTSPAPGERNVAGVLTPLPVPGLRVANTRVTSQDAPVVPMLYPRAGELAELFGEAVFDGMVLLAPDAPDGFLRDWRPAGPAPAKHVGYAVQWFSFAGTLAVLYLVLNFRRPPSLPDGARGYGSKLA